MKRIKSSLVVMSLMLVLPLCAQAGGLLSGEDVSSLFADKTFDVESVKTDLTFKVYASSDGHYIVKYTSGEKKGETQHDKWFVINDMQQHCHEFVSRGYKSCGWITDEGDGVYHKESGGMHSQTLRNFVDGNQL